MAIRQHTDLKNSLDQLRVFYLFNTLDTPNFRKNERLAIFRVFDCLLNTYPKLYDKVQ